MARYHIVHIVPDERFHGLLHGYREVIDTLIWGLTELGHHVTYDINNRADDAINILLGWQLCSVDLLSGFPEGTILYNLEMRKFFIGREKIDDNHYYVAEHFQIWDFSLDNITFWKTLNPVRPAKFVPIGYAPLLSRIAPRDQDIDVLFYGSPQEKRLATFRTFTRQPLKVIFAFCIYGDMRDELIARSKIVLNICQYDTIFEITRVSYLLANAKAVVADSYPGLTVESDVIDCVRFADRDAIAEACRELIDDDDLRHDYERRGFETFRRRDIRVILQTALAD